MKYRDFRPARLLCAAAAFLLPLAAAAALTIYVSPAAAGTP